MLRTVASLMRNSGPGAGSALSLWVSRWANTFSSRGGAFRKRWRTELSFSSRAVWLDQAAVLLNERSSMAYARIILNNSSPFLMLRQRSTAPQPLAKSLRLAGKYWHRYFQSVFIKFLSMPISLYQSSKLSIPYSSAYAPGPSPGPSPHWGEGKVNVRFNSLAPLGE